MAVADRLVEITRKNLEILKKLYALNANAQNYVSYTTIDNYIRWFEKESYLKHIKVYCLNGNISDGTFVIIDRCFVYADTLSHSYKNLTRLLELIDYSQGYHFYGLRFELRQAVCDALHRANVDIDFSSSSLLYCLPKNEALKFDVRSYDVELRTLTEHHDLKKVNSHWTYCSRNSMSMFQQIAKNNPNVGAFRKDGTLVAWMFRFPIGLLGALQTDERFYCRGYGSLVMRSLSKKVAEMGHDVYTSVLESNIPSRSLFHKHGFIFVGKIQRFITKPKNERLL